MSWVHPLTEHRGQLSYECVVSPVLGAACELDAAPALKEFIVEARSENTLSHIIKCYRIHGRRSMLRSVRNEGERGFRWGRGSERLPWEVAVFSPSQLWNHLVT